LDTLGFLKALKQVGFKGCLALEYEENPEDPVADIRECLQVVQETIKRV
jgi:sugar phosphate isomerase/epimerase